MKLQVWVFTALLSSVSLPSQTALAQAVDEDTLQRYQTEVYNKVHTFGNRNRFNINNVNRDKYSNCYLTLTIATTVSADGSIKETAVKKSSNVAIVDKYFQYIISQSAPFKPLTEYFGPDLQELELVQDFTLDLNINHNSRSQKSCD